MDQRVRYIRNRGKRTRVKRVCDRALQFAYTNAFEAFRGYEEGPSYLDVYKIPEAFSIPAVVDKKPTLDVVVMPWGYVHVNKENGFTDLAIPASALPKLIEDLQEAQAKCQ